MKKLVYILAIITFFNSCSKDDPVIEPEESFIEGGTIKILSLVKITNEDIIQDQYTGKIGNIDVLFYKTDEKELTFKVPNSSEIGENILEIPNLNNLKIKYEVIDTVLQGTPEENILSYFTTADNYFLTSNNSSNAKNYFQNLNNYFQNASEDEKILMAKFYKANQNQFDAILNRDFLNKSAGKSYADEEDLEILLKYVSAVLACGVTTAIATFDPEPATKAIAAGIALIAFGVADDLNRDFANKNVIKANVVIEGILSDLASKSSKKSELILYNEIEKSFDFQSKSRALINSDSNNNNDNVSKFFTYQNTYNSFIEKINSAISFVNDKLFFVNIILLELSKLEDSKPELIENVNDLFFNNVTFSIESDNINVENISFNDGKLNIKVIIIDESIVNEFVETKLNYSYQDDFNDISGSFSLKVFKACSELNDIKSQIIGSWSVNIITQEAQNDPANYPWYDLEMFENGTGEYTVDGKKYEMTWSVYCENGNYYFTDYGFWHRGGYGDQISFPLNNPISEIITESKFTAGEESRKFIKK